MSKARELIEAAKEVGCDIVKFQLYDTDKIKKPDETNYAELKQAELTKDDLYILKETAKKAEIEFLCSVFDKERLGWYMETLPQRHKVASRSIYDKELIKAMEDTGLPIIVSTANWKEPKLPDYSADYLYCLTRRQILREGIDIEKFPQKFDPFRGYAGFSDHAVGVELAMVALGRGARIIEKHFTFDKNAPGWDQPGSANPIEMNLIVQYAKHLEEKEDASRHFNIKLNTFGG